jgi:galactonate dehydratase
MINQNFTFGDKGKKNKTILTTLKNAGYTVPGGKFADLDDAIKHVNLAIADENVGGDKVLNAYANRREESYVKTSEKDTNYTFNRGWMKRLNEHRTENKIDSTKLTDTEAMTTDSLTAARVVTPETIVNLVKDFKKEFSSKMDLIVYAVQGSTANPWATKVSINLAKQLEEYKILFFEEPCRVENIEGYKEIKRSTNLNIAGAESIPTARAFKPYLESEVFDVVQFDIATSGFTEGRRIADLAYIYNKPVALHSWGSAISIMAGIHFGLTIPNSAFTEYCFMDHPLNELLFEDSKIEIKNGYVTRPGTYGLGVKFNEGILKKFSYKEKVNTMISTEEADIQLI